MPIAFLMQQQTFGLLAQQNGELQRLKEENRLLREENEVLKTKLHIIKEWEAEKGNLNGCIAELREENRSLREENASLKKAVEQLQKDVNTLRAGLSTREAVRKLEAHILAGINAKLSQGTAKYKEIRQLNGAMDATEAAKRKPAEEAVKAAQKDWKWDFKEIMTVLRGYKTDGNVIAHEPKGGAVNVHAGLQEMEQELRDDYPQFYDWIKAEQVFATHTPSPQPDSQRAAADSGGAPL